jgi:hypothetical protein
MEKSNKDKELRVIAKKAYIDFILDYFNKGVVDKAMIVTDFCSKFQKSSRTFETYYQNAQQEHLKQRETINEAIMEETIKTEKEAVKIIINSKLERLEIYQKQILDCVKELNHGFTEDMKNGELFSRPLNINEKSAIRRSIKDLQSEISKIEGDYATSKLEMSFNVGLDMEEEFE